MLCVLAKLDEKSTEKLNVLRKSANGQAKPLHGHITVASYTGGDEARFTERCKDMLDGMPAFSVRFGSVAVLKETSVIVALPERSEALDALHARIAEAFSNELDFWTGDRWLPHTTLYFDDKADLAPVLSTVSKRFHPFTAQILQIEFSRVTETGYTILDAIDLK